MSLVILVRMEDNGLIGDDDGNEAWRSTTVAFAVGSANIIGTVLADGYSGDKRATLTRDDFNLPARLAEPLVIALYRLCGVEMREAPCEIGEAILDVESLIRWLFYTRDAQTVMRKLLS